MKPRLHPLDETTPPGSHPWTVYRFPHPSQLVTFQPPQLHPVKSLAVCPEQINSLAHDSQLTYIPLRRPNKFNIMVNVQAEFDLAVEKVKSLPPTGPVKPTQDDQLLFYGHYKQANEGDNTTTKPGMCLCLCLLTWLHCPNTSSKERSVIIRSVAKPSCLNGFLGVPCSEIPSSITTLRLNAFP